MVSNQPGNSASNLSMPSLTNENKNRVHYLNNSEFANQWWQLFDSKAKRFYYYNVYKQQTSWEKPNETEEGEETNSLQTDKQQTVLLMLASKILELLNLNVDLNFNEDIRNILHDLKEKLISENEINLDQDLIFLNNLLKKEIASPTSSPDSNNSTEFKKSISSFLTNSSILSSHSLNSSSSFTADSNNQTKQSNKTDKRQPRTNPNYVNVDLIDKQSGSLLKNTYVKLQEISDDMNKTPKNLSMENLNNINSTNSIGKKYLIKKTNSRSKLNKNSSDSTMSLNNVFGLSKVTLLLMALLDENNELNESKLKKVKSETSDSSADTLCTMTQQQNLSSNNLSLSSCFLANDTNDDLKDPKMLKSKENLVSNSLNQKNIEKKFSFLSIESNKKQKQQNINLNENNSKTLNSLLIKNKSSVDLKNSKHQQQNHIQDQTTKSPIIIDDSLLYDASSIDILTDENSTTLNYSFSPSTTSLADLNQLSSAHKHLQFNQRLKNLRRSFNNKNSTVKSKCSFSETTSATLTTKKNLKKSDQAATTSLSYMLNCAERLNKTDNLDIENLSPILARKPSETNLLIIKKNHIDLNVHHEKFKSGFLFFGSKKKIPDQDLMIWTNQTIQKPLLKTNNKIIKKEACELFKLIQVYMGDRKMFISTNLSNQNSLKNSKLLQNSSKINSTSFNESNFLEQLNSTNQNDLICLEIMTKGWMHPQLRDELYLQIVKQTTSNLSKQSALLGWQLMAVCLSFFPPTQKLYPFLNEYILTHTLLDEEDENKFYLSNNLSSNSTLSILSRNDPKNENNDSKFLSKLAKTCLRRLEKIHVTGAKKGLKSPSIEEVILSKTTILNPSLFGTKLDEIMMVQRKKCPELELPWIQTTLSEAVLRLNGSKTEGIFRVPGDLDEVNNLKVRFDKLWCQSEQILSKNSDTDIFQNITDPHLPASLLKLWYRELYEPLIPNEFYDECIMYCDQPDKCLKVIEKLPKMNRLVFTYLIKFLKVFADSENVAVTKMDANNLSMVMAPNCLRCKSNEPKTIMENTKKEMQFLKTLIQHLDTSIVQDIL